MKLNNIFCGGYSTYKNEVEFSLIDTNYNVIDNNVWGPPSEQPNYWDLYEA